MTGTFKKIAIVASAAAAMTLATPASAAAFVGLFNTGVDGGGLVTAPNTVDAHYSVVQVVQIGNPNPIAIPNGGDVYATTFGAWSANDAVGTPGSSWITPYISALGTPTRSSGLGEPPFDYDYQLDFTYSGAIADAVLGGQIQSDNYVRIFLNGTEIGGQAPVASPGDLTYFQKFTAFGHSGAPFVSGNNTLTFRVRDYGVVTGLRVGELTGGVVPEPGVWAMMIVGFGLVAGQIRRRRRVGTVALA